MPIGVGLVGTSAATASGWSLSIRSPSSSICNQESTLTQLDLCKVVLVSGVAVLALGTRGAFALDDDSAKALLKKSDCTKCHAIDKDKKGPSYQKIAADNKGKAGAEAKLIKSITAGATVKLSDGSEEEHKPIESKDAVQVKGLVQWIMAR